MDLEKGEEDTKEVDQISDTKIPNMTKKVSFKPNPVTDYKLENM